MISYKSSWRTKAYSELIIKYKIEVENTSADVLLVCLMLMCFTPCSSIYIVQLEQVNACYVMKLEKMPVLTDNQILNGKGNRKQILKGKY